MEHIAVLLCSGSRSSTGFKSGHQGRSEPCPESTPKLHLPCACHDKRFTTSRPYMDDGRDCALQDFRSYRNLKVPYSPSHSIYRTFFWPHSLFFQCSIFTAQGINRIFLLLCMTATRQNEEKKEGCEYFLCTPSSSGLTQVRPCVCEQLSWTEATQIVSTDLTENNYIVVIFTIPNSINSAELRPISMSNFIPTIKLLHSS